MRVSKGHRELGFPSSTSADLRLRPPAHYFTLLMYEIKLSINIMIAFEYLWYGDLSETGENMPSSHNVQLFRRDDLT